MAATLSAAKRGTRASQLLKTTVVLAASEASTSAYSVAAVRVVRGPTRAIFHPPRRGSCVPRPA